MARLFVSLRPPRPVRDALLSAQGGVEGARWQDEDQLHLTLRFCGEVDRRTADDLVAALGSFTAAPFELAVRGVGHFERKGRPHTLWAGLAPCPALERLQRRVERACRAAGQAPEPRKFAPHLTLARIGGAAQGIGEWLARYGALAAPEWNVGSFRLYESRLGHGGSVYTPLAEWPLEPAGGRFASTNAVPVA
ncbi:RNA 2',3'-cyclic phosphodiesterase [Tsuneonella sp. HG249]